MAADAAAAVAGGAEATLPLGGGKELLLMRDWNVVDRVDGRALRSLPLPVVGVFLRLLGA